MRKCTACKGFIENDDGYFRLTSFDKKIQVSESFYHAKCYNEIIGRAVDQKKLMEKSNLIMNAAMKGLGIDVTKEVEINGIDK